MNFKKKKILAFLVGFYCLEASYALAKEETPFAALNDALEELRASTSAWRDNDTDFRSMRRSGKLPEEEVIEFAELVAELKRQVIEDCDAVRKLEGKKFLKEHDCHLPKELPTPSSVSISQPEAHKTETEELQALDEKLRNIESSIDVLVKKSAEYVTRNKNNRNSELPLIPGNAQQLPTGSEKTSQIVLGASVSSEIDKSRKSSKVNDYHLEGAYENAKENSKSLNIPGIISSPSEKGAGSGREQKGNHVGHRSGPVVVAGTDDDVIAAQIREAAENETDKVLREKLWLEYKKYKMSTR